MARQRGFEVALRIVFVPVALSARQLCFALRDLASRFPAFANAIAEMGPPVPRVVAPGYGTLLRTILGQQVSVASATACFEKLDRVLGDVHDPQRILDATDATLNACGLSRQKIRYARDLAGLVARGELDLARLPRDDEEAIAALVQIKGVGRWSAEIYLLFAEGRPDVWPAGDLAIQVELARMLGLDARPSEEETRTLAEPWRPHRGAIALLAWQHYEERARVRRAAKALASEDRSSRRERPS